MATLHPSPPPVHRLTLTPGELARDEPALYRDLYTDADEAFAAYVADALRRVAYTERELRGGGRT